MTQKEYKEKVIDKFVLKIYETNLYLQGRHLLYLIKPKNNEYNDSRLIITYNVVDASQPTLLYGYYAEEGQEEYWVKGVDLFDKVEIDGTEVTVESLDNAQGMYQLSAGEHTVKYTLKDPTSIGIQAFYECSGLTSITIPDSVTNIGNSAFQGCTSLTSVNIPNSVTSIGYNAFYNCSGLTSVTIPDSVTSISTYAFYNCSGLTSVTIGSGVTSIGNRAFQGCRSLTSVNIPSSVVNIGDNAFNTCNSLTSITIPDSVTNIGNYAFCGCPLDAISKTAIKAINPNAIYCGGGGKA